VLQVWRYGTLCQHVSQSKRSWQAWGHRTWLGRTGKNAPTEAVLAYVIYHAICIVIVRLL
jgi:hypothetical protein